jgi:uncharacterized small protein (TIGR04563 family)
MPKVDPQKQSLYFPREMIEEIAREACRQDRSLSWIVQQAWRLAREEIGKLPAQEAAPRRYAPRRDDPTSL